MKNAVIYTWNTTKCGNAFEFKIKMLTPVSEKLPDGTYCKTEVIKTGKAHSRATAVSKAKEWVRYYNAAKHDTN